MVDSGLVLNWGKTIDTYSVLYGYLVIANYVTLGLFPLGMDWHSFRMSANIEVTLHKKHEQHQPYNCSTAAHHAGQQLNFIITYQFMKSQTEFLLDLEHGTYIVPPSY